MWLTARVPNGEVLLATAAIRSREGKCRHQTICALTANAMAGDRERWIPDVAETVQQ